MIQLLLNQNKNIVFQVFEYASYNTYSGGKEGKKLPIELFEALKGFIGEKELPYYSLTANGVKFKQFVGAIQIGKYCIEVLPKIDRGNDSDLADKILISMLRQSGLIDIRTPTESSLRIKQNYILEAYINLFLNECESIIHRGLIKSYRKEEGNLNALKGKIIFNKQLSKNLVHDERFYISYTTYDRQNPLNRILFKTLNLIAQLANSGDVHYKTTKLLFSFSEMKDISVSEEVFSRIIWGRKTKEYRNAIEIARLLLLNYHPDLSTGKNDVLALMFDMNDLWEKWFTRKLRTAAFSIDKRIEIKAQIKSSFWSGLNGETIRQKPDILVKLPNGFRIVLDTKWKLVNCRPSEDDIRQMFAYNKLFNSKHSYLIYPGSNNSITGTFFDNTNNGSCGLEFIQFVKEGKLDSSGIELLLNRLINLGEESLGLLITNAHSELN
jgi:5-methylcytosine-specific restriction enzyme subunit McrC